LAVVGVAPCQCFLPGGHRITSPGRISSLASPQHWVQPRPDVTISAWPSGWVCQAVRAPGSNVTLAPRTRAGARASNSGSILTAPVKCSADPVVDGREPFRLISMIASLIAWSADPAGLDGESRECRAMRLAGIMRIDL